MAALKQNIEIVKLLLENQHIELNIRDEIKNLVFNKIQIYKFND